VVIRAAMLEGATVVEEVPMVAEEGPHLAEEVAGAEMVGVDNLETKTRPFL